MRPDGIAEQRVIVPPLQAIAAAILLVRPAGGQIVHPFDVIIDDGIVAHGGTEDAEAVVAQGPDQRRQAVEADH